MPSPLSPPKRDTILYLQSTEIHQIDAAKVVGCHVQTIKNYAKKRRAWGNVEPLSIAKRGRTPALTVGMIQVCEYPFRLFMFLSCVSSTSLFTNFRTSKHSSRNNHGHTLMKWLLSFMTSMISLFVSLHFIVHLK